MPTANEVLGGLLERAIRNPKTTAQSVLTVLMFVALGLTSCGCVSGKVLLIAGGVLSFAKIVLGMLQTDGIQLPPGTTASSTTSTKITTPSPETASDMKTKTSSLIAVILCASLCLCMAGCTAADTQKAISLVEAELPTAISLASEIAQIVLVFGNAQDQANTKAAVGTITGSLNELQTLCAQYTAKPSATTYQSVLAVVDSLVGTGDTALLNAAKIDDPASQQKATAIIGSLDVVLHLIDGYVQATQSTSQVKATAARRTVRLRALQGYWSESDRSKFVAAAGVPYPVLYARAEALGF